MRMRKKKWAEGWMEEHSSYITKNPSQYKGSWKERLNSDILHVEIGMGKGDYLIGMSSIYSDYAWVGIEKDPSAAAVAARKAVEEEHDLSNNMMICSNAEQIDEWFDEGEIDVIHLNFSDPWPKSRYHKRRLSSSKFLEMYKKLLSEDGEIQMKTDNKSLFEDSVLYFLQNGFTLKEFSVDFRRNAHPEDVITEYESKFMEEGLPIYRLVAIVKQEDE